MILHNIKTSFKKLIANRLYTFINIGGLSLSFAIAILILLYVNNELNTDRYHKNIDYLYRLTENKDKHSYTAAKFIDYIIEKYPEVKYSTRYKEFSGIFQYGDNKSIKIDHVAFMDSSCLEMFTINIVKSNKSKLLRTDQSIIISETIAHKFFGSEDPIGKIIRFENEHDYTIEGVFEDYPSNSNFQHDAIAYFPSVRLFWGYPKYNVLIEEGNWSFSTFLMLQQGVNLMDLNDRLKTDLVQRFGRPTEFYLQPFTDIYFNNDIRDDMRHGKEQIVYLFLTIAIIIIFIAIINYINLSTSVSTQRALSIGINKTLGAHRKSLIFQFLIETIIISLFSLVLGFVLAELFMPTFNNLLQYNLHVKSFYSFPFNIIAIIFSIIIGVLSGLYPAFYLTRFSPIEILRNKVSKTKGMSLFKKGLMIFQFIITITLITGTIIVYKQLNYWRNMDMGFNKENILVLNLGGEVSKNPKLFKERVEKVPGVQQVCFSSGTAGNVDNGLYDKIDDQKIIMRHLYVDANYFEMFGIEVIDGEGFSKTNPEVNKQKYLLNEAAVKYLNWESPYEKDIWRWKCIGVVKDFIFASQHDVIGPLFISFNDGASTVNIKIESLNIPLTIKQIEEIWTDMSPEHPFEYKFIDDLYNDQYKSEERLTKLLGYFAIFSILIACLGLFGLISFFAEQRTKEIGIRKANGASIINIILMFSREFVQLVILSGIIAIPLSYYILRSWLQDFAYATKLSWWVFVVSILLAVIVSSLSVLYRAYRTASQTQ